jgi:anti-sigma B factor antagonist
MTSEHGSGTGTTNGLGKEGKSAALLHISTRDLAAARIVILEGELDMSTAQEFEEKTSQAVQDLQGDLVLDIEKLSFVDSSGLAVIIGLHQKLHSLGWMLIISTPTPNVRRLLRITGLDEMLIIRPAAGT